MSTFASLEWYAEVVRTIDALYLEHLRRPSEALGNANWLWHAREGGKDAEWIKARILESPEYKQVHATPPVPPPTQFKPAPRFWKGNMCGVRVPGLPPVAGGADASLVLSWFYDRYTASDRAKIRASWKAKGYTHSLLSWPDSRAHGSSPSDFLATCKELIADGFYPCVMLCSKDHDTPHVPTILANINQVLPLLVGTVPMFCVGWELSLWLQPIQVQQLIDTLSPQWLAQPGTLGYVHFQQGYAAFSQEVNGASTTADFWRANVGKLHGVLHQRDLSWGKTEYVDRMVDVLQRCAGQFNWPGDSGFGHPFDCVAFEITAWDQFNHGMSEAEGDEWGRIAVNTPAQGGVRVMGSGNGG